MTNAYGAGLADAVALNLGEDASACRQDTRRQQPISRALFRQSWTQAVTRSS